jgi:hypothetical protein
VSFTATPAHLPGESRSVCFDPNFLSLCRLWLVRESVCSPVCLRSAVTSCSNSSRVLRLTVIGSPAVGHLCAPPEGTKSAKSLFSVCMKTPLFAMAVLPAFLAACNTPGPTYVERGAGAFESDEQLSGYNGRSAIAARSGSKMPPPRPARPRRSVVSPEPIRHADPLDLKDRPPPREAQPPLPIPGGGSMEETMTAGVLPDAGRGGIDTAWAAPAPARPGTGTPPI